MVVAGDGGPVADGGPVVDGGGVVDAVLAGSGADTGRVLVGAAVPAVVESLADLFEVSLGHAVSSPPSAAPPTARMRVRREYTTNVYPSSIRNACESPMTGDDM
jgi:hypothetical protein